MESLREFLKTKKIFYLIIVWLILGLFIFFYLYNLNPNACGSYKEPTKCGNFFNYLFDGGSLDIFFFELIFIYSIIVFSMFLFTIYHYLNINQTKFRIFLTITILMLFPIFYFLIFGL